MVPWRGDQDDNYWVSTNSESSVDNADFFKFDRDEKEDKVAERKEVIGEVEE